jgi:hypothetical protein
VCVVCVCEARTQALAAQRCTALARDKVARPDERVAHRHLLLGAPLALANLTLYPRLVPLHTRDDASTQAAMSAHAAALPRALPLAIASLAADGVYLLHAGTEQFYWIDKQADARLLAALFGMSRPTPADLSMITCVPVGGAPAPDAEVEVLRDRCARIVKALATRYRYVRVLVW